MSRAAALLLLLATAATAAQAQPGPLSAFSFLRLEPSARGAALGGAFGAVYDGDVNGLFYNPALPSEASHQALSVSYLNHLGDLNAGFLAYGHHVKGLGTLGGGLRFLSYGTFEGFDEEGRETGTFGAGDVALTVGLARGLSGRWRYGASLHAVYAGIESAWAAALAADLGALYYWPEQHLGLSASVHNMGLAARSLGETRDRLPFDLRLGLAKRLDHLPLLLTLTAYNLHDLASGDAESTLERLMPHLALGGELQIVEAFRVRLGYNHRRQQELRQSDGFDTAGLSAGFGLFLAPFAFDYAFSSWSSLGGLHQFTLRVRL